MSIKDLQRRQTEVGRIRIGETKDTGRKNKHGDPIMRPVKLEKFRFTSPSKTLIEQVASIYGGTPAEWAPQGGGAVQWEVYTEADSLPVVVPPNAVSQWYEAWAGGACVRRCDGEREMLKDQPCLCPPDPSERQCKPTTRISLMLAEVPGIGVWRLESHGYYAATELPAVAELLAAAGGFVAGRLELEERSARRAKADGSGMETRRWMVPVLHVDAAPAELLALTGPGHTAIGGAERPAIAAAPAEPEPDGDGPMSATPEVIDGIRQMIADAPNEPELRAVWRGLGDSGITVAPDVKAELTQLFWARLKTVRDEAKGAPAEPVQEPDKTAAWTAALALAAETGWSTSDTSLEFRERMGKDVTAASGSEIVAFTEALRSEMQGAAS